MSNSFGQQLKEYRKKAGMTQDELARAINRKSMLISLFESGKNDPPNGPLLEGIIIALSLNDIEANRLRFLAAKQRCEVPSNISDYFFSTDAIAVFIKTAQELGVKEEGWHYLIEDLLRSSDEIENKEKPHEGV